MFVPVHIQVQSLVLVNEVLYAPFQGQMTGVCVNATNTCEVLTWCPVEDDHNIPKYVDTPNSLFCKIDLCSEIDLLEVQTEQLWDQYSPCFISSR